MRPYCILILVIIFGTNGSCAQDRTNVTTYLDSIKTELEKEWPKNKTINLVFHGHSVPSGYFKTPEVNTLASYPHLTLVKVKRLYPTAVVNSITTAIGGEQAEQGAERFREDVLNHRPDILFIDYALNDRSVGLERAKVAWESMIKEALAYGAKVILMTPTPDLAENILSDKGPLEKHSEQIRQLAVEHNVGLVDSYALFKEIAKTEDLRPLMAQDNHVNEKGHEIVAEAIVAFFQKNELIIKK